MRLRFFAGHGHFIGEESGVFMDYGRCRYEVIWGFSLIEGLFRLFHWGMDKGC